MQSQELIPIDIFCRHHGVTESFINALHDFGLIEVSWIDEIEYIPKSQLKEAEKLIRLHTDLDINLEGIDAITHLLYLLNQMQAEVLILNNKLRLYELVN